MLEFYVQDMTCQHCINAITLAIKDVAAQAQVDIDLDKHLVRIQGEVQAQAIQTAITQAGYTPEPRTS